MRHGEQRPFHRVTRLSAGFTQVEVLTAMLVIGIAVPFLMGAAHAFNLSYEPALENDPSKRPLLALAAGGLAIRRRPWSSAERGASPGAKG